MMKEHKKLYKSGKNWMVATLATVTVATAGMALAGTTNVHADATTPVQAPAQTTQDTELANAQSDAQLQQQKISDQSAKLDEQNQQLSDAQGQQSSAQQALDQAKQAQQEATANDADVQQTQQQVNNQQTIVDQASDTVKADQQGVQSAQSAYDQAKQTATGAINQSADQQKQEAQSTIDNLESQGKSTQTSNLDNQINNVSGQVTDAQNDVNSTNSQISSLQNQVQELQNQQGQSTNTNPNIKQVPNGYIDTSKSLLENASRNNLWMNNDLSQDNGNIIPQNIYVSPDNNKTASNPYANIGDASGSQYDNYFNTDFDLVNQQAGMTNSQKQEMAILLMNMINHARGQRGLPAFTMTEQKYNQAQVRASQRSAQSLTHDVNDMITAFGQDQYECLAYIPTRGGSNMLSLLYNAGSTLSQMLNADASSDWGHRENFLNEGNWNAAFGFHLTDDGQYYVLTFDYDNTASGDGDTTPNMMDRIANYAAEGPISGSTTTVDNSAQIANLNSQISDLQNTLASQKSNLQSLQTQLQNLQAQKANVQFDLSQLTPDQQTQYNNAKNTLSTIDNWKADQLANIDNEDSVKTAKSTLDSANSILQRDKDNQTQAQQDLATLQQKLDDAETKANASAEQAVKDAQDKLNKINTKISGLQEAIATTKQNIQNAQDQLAKDNQKIDELKNGQKPSQPDQPAKGGDQGTTTPTNPSTGDNTGKGNDTTNPSTPTTPTKPDDGKSDAGTTTPSQPTTGNKGDDTTNPTTPAEPHQPAKGDDQGTTTPTNPTTPAKPDNGNASIAGQAGHKPGKAENSEGTTTSESGKSETVTMTREQYKTQQQANSTAANTTLPKTGNENSAAVVALGILSAMFGLGLASKSKKEF